ncbi:MAG: hypothetical protein Q7S38_01660, partial [bacterium]|nr:hypothetical protein [bacterium]
LNPKGESLISPRPLSHLRLKLSPIRLKDTTHVLFKPASLSVNKLEINVESYPLLKECDIRLIGDFFTIPFEHIQKRWRGTPDELIGIFTKVRDRLFNLYNECRVFKIPSEPYLFLHITNSVLCAVERDVLDGTLGYLGIGYAYTADNFAEKDRMEKMYDELNQRPSDEKTIPTYDDILIFGQDSTERSARRRIFKHAFEQFNLALDEAKKQKRTPWTPYSS